MNRARILLADDQPSILAGIRGILSPHYEIVGTVADGQALVETALRLKPDLIISDITMLHLNGIDAAIQIKTRLPGIKLLFVTAHSSSAYVRAALEAGGTGYILKSTEVKEFLDAVQSVLRGNIYISPGLSTEHLGRFELPAATTPRLSEREREILRLIAEGRTAKEIAPALNISNKAVAFHLGNMKRKLGLRTASELTKHAIQQGLIP